MLQAFSNCHIVFRVSFSYSETLVLQAHLAIFRNPWQPLATFLIQPEPKSLRRKFGCELECEQSN